MKTIKNVILLTVAVAFFAALNVQAYFDPSVGRFASRDPIEESSFLQNNNLSPQIQDALSQRRELNDYAFVLNNPVTSVDLLGLWATDVHHKIVEDWLSDPKYEKYPCACCKIDVRGEIEFGSDDVDGVGPFGTPAIGIAEALSSADAYQHAMRGPHQTVAEAKAKYDAWISKELSLAHYFASQNGCLAKKLALRELGRAYHSYSDSLSPAHAGFQVWYGPLDWTMTYGDPFSYIYWTEIHASKETMSVYNGTGSSVWGAVKGKFQGDLDSILKNCGN
jgi:RHS repeat-associated protein